MSMGSIFPPGNTCPGNAACQKVFDLWALYLAIPNSSLLPSCSSLALIACHVFAGGLLKSWGGLHIWGGDGQTGKHAWRQNAAPWQLQSHAQRGLLDAAMQTGTPALCPQRLCAHVNAGVSQQSHGLTAPSPPVTSVMPGCPREMPAPQHRDLAASRHSQLPWAFFNSANRALINVTSFRCCRFSLMVCQHDNTEVVRSRRRTW